MTHKTTVNVAPNTDLNDGLPPEQQQEHIPDFLPMDEDIYHDLPHLLCDACGRLADNEERETFLIGALGVLSGMLPNVQGTYFGRQVQANLYCFIIGRYGTGKGALLWARDLGEAAEGYLQQLTVQATAQYEEEEAQYQRQMKLYDKGKLPSPPQMPRQPRHLKFYLPANTTKTAVMQLLMENEGRGVIFETEGDTLADMLRQDYGNFSDVLRKAFHHEPVSYFRRANNEDVKINSPALSVVLSGTQDQLHRLIPSIENGLFSRFMFYVLQSNAPFKNPFDSEADDHQYYFGRLSHRMLGMYRKLLERDEPIWFKLQPAQQQEFVRHFHALKEEIRQHISADLDGTINRLGLITYRIAMVLTAIRNIDAQHGTLHCTNTDFNNAIRITNHLLHYSLHIYEGLQKERKENPLAPITYKEEKIRQCCQERSMGLSYEEIAERVLGDRKKKSTVWGWIIQHCKAS